MGRDDFDIGRGAADERSGRGQNSRLTITTVTTE